MASIVWYPIEHFYYDKYSTIPNQEAKVMREKFTWIWFKSFLIYNGIIFGIFLPRHWNYSNSRLMWHNIRSIPASFVIANIVLGHLYYTTRFHGRTMPFYLCEKEPLDTEIPVPVHDLMTAMYLIDISDECDED